MPVLSRGGKASAMSATVRRPIPEKPLLETPTQNAATRQGRAGMAQADQAKRPVQDRVAV